MLLCRRNSSWSPWVVATLKDYVQATKDIQECSSLTNLFITTVKSYRNASKDTVSYGLHNAEVPVKVKAHSTQSAAMSGFLKKGIDVKTILRKASWFLRMFFTSFTTVIKYVLW